MSDSYRMPFWCKAFCGWDQSTLSNTTTMSTTIRMATRDMPSAYPPEDET